MQDNNNQFVIHFFTYQTMSKASSPELSSSFSFYSSFFLVSQVENNFYSILLILLNKSKNNKKEI